MSQAGVISFTSSPAVATTYVTDAGNAVPVANVLNILGDDSTTNNLNGITTTGAGNTVTVLLTNRVQGTGTTIGAVTSDIITFSMGAVAATYVFEFRVKGFEATTPAGCGYSVFATVRTTGAAATVCGVPDVIVNEEAALVNCDVDVVASGNNAILRVTGTAGLTVTWGSVGYYT